MGPLVHFPVCYLVGNTIEELHANHNQFDKKGVKEGVKKNGITVQGVSVSQDDLRKFRIQV